MNSTEVNNYCNVGLPIDIVRILSWYLFELTVIEKTQGGFGKNIPFDPGYTPSDMVDFSWRD